MHTSKRRTFQSAKAFAAGIFPEVKNITVDFQSPDDDLLRVRIIVENVKFTQNLNSNN